MTSLGEYLEQMRKRHPRLSMRRMSLDAGISVNTVRNIIKEGANAEPDTIRLLADKWGTSDDYLIMMRLAGHLAIKPSVNRGNLSPATQKLLDKFVELPPQAQERIANIFYGIIELAENAHGSKWDK